MSALIEDTKDEELRYVISVKSSGVFAILCLVTRLVLTCIYNLRRLVAYREGALPLLVDLFQISKVTYHLSFGCTVLSLTL